MDNKFFQKNVRIEIQQLSCDKEIKVLKKIFIFIKILFIISHTAMTMPSKPLELDL